MTVEDIKQNGNKNPSDELIQLIDSLVMTYKQTTEDRNKQVKAIIDQGRSEGLEDMQIRELIEIALKKHGLSDKTIVRALPQELKHTNMIREHKQVQQIDSSEIVDPDPDNVSLIDKPVYREPDRVEPRPEWNKDKMDTVQEQSFRTTTNIAEDKTNDYHIMNVPVTDSRPLSDSRVPVPEPIDPNYTVTTQLQINNGTGNNIGQFTVDVVCHCYPMNKTVELEPIDKATIKKVKQ